MLSIVIFCIFLTLITTTIQNTLDSDPVYYIFHNISKEVEKTTINLFKALILPRNFLTSQLIKKEADMYKYLKATVSENYKFYKNLSKVNDDQRNLLPIDNAISDIMNGNINGTNAEATVVGEFKFFIPLITSKTDPDNPYELSLGFIREFINKVDNLKLADIINPNRNESSNILRHKDKTDYENEIETWDPNEIKGSRRLFEGKSVGIANYPFMASVHQNGKFVGAGCIIRSELVISAASCLQRVQDNKDHKHYISVRVGSNKVNSGGYMVRATHAIFHPSYDVKSLWNNLVLISVAVGSFARLKWIKRIKYQEPQTQLDSLKIIGWGQQHEVAGNSRITDSKFKTKAKFLRNESALPVTDLYLTYDNLEVYSLEECSSVYSRYYITKNNICAGYMLSGNGACQYDIGGPAIQNGLLVGVVSFGPPRCGARDEPTVFTTIAPYLKWIHTVLHEIIPNTRSKRNNETYVKYSQAPIQNYSCLESQRTRSVMYRRLMNVNPPGITKDLRRKDSRDNPDENLLPLLCLFDDNCELDIYSDNDDNIQTRAEAEKAVHLNTSAEINFYDKENQANVKNDMITQDAIYGPVFLHIVPKYSKGGIMAVRGSHEPLAPTASSNQLPQTKHDTNEDNERTKEFINKRNDGHVHLYNSDISDIAAKLLVKKAMKANSQIKRKGLRQRPHRKRRKTKRRRKIKMVFKPELKLGWTYIK